MARPFLKSVAQYIFEHHKDTIETLCIVLPNKRGALFLKNYLAQEFSKTMWLPNIISAEDLVNELSGLQILEEIDLLCHLYESYKICYGEQAETFDSFAKWGQLMLQDFNEIDRYLVDAAQLFENLKDIKVIENWSLGEEQLSEFQLNYLQFMSSIAGIYKHFSEFLRSQKWAYQGLAYKQAVVGINQNAYLNGFEKILFCGFNALNAAELKIIRSLELQKKSVLLWDADRYYVENKNQEAGMFLRSNFEYFNQAKPYFIEDNFKTQKNIHIFSVPKQMGQAQAIKQKLRELIAQGVPLDTVAVVLANEKLLWPVLQQLPEEIEHVNITMEYPLRYTSTYSFIDCLLQIQYSFSKQNRQQKTIYYKELLALLRQPLFQHYLKANQHSLPLNLITQKIKQGNLTFISNAQLKDLFSNQYEMIAPLFSPILNSEMLCELLISVITCVKEYFALSSHKPLHKLEMEYLHIILNNFKRLQELLKTYPHFNDIQAFKQLYQQVVGNASAPFIGEPLRGLQIMGVLETRTLDFEHVILVNVNEGVLPSGKSNHSFIPNDLKRAFGLPLYLEKDAIYAYHFYRLLQRASDIVITYDSETDSFGKGEKSRYITQLLLELKDYHSEITISENIAIEKKFPEKTSSEIRIQKNELSLKHILEKASGKAEYFALSPSSLLSFKACSLKFYFRYGVKLKAVEVVEESAEANTFGSILHNSLENLYKSFIEKPLYTTALKKQIPEINNTVSSAFEQYFKTNAPSGKNLLQEEVIKVYVKKLLNKDIEFVTALDTQKETLTLHALEKEFSAELDISIENKKSKVYIKGKIDRIDSYKNVLRIIDYKSSVKPTDKFIFNGFDHLFGNKDYDKQLQLMLYAWLLYKNDYTGPEKILSCIIPFKVFVDEPYYLLGKDKRPLLFSVAFLKEFEAALIVFIEGIFNCSQDFMQTEDLKTCSFCDYKLVCQRDL